MALEEGIGPRASTRGGARVKIQLSFFVKNYMIMIISYHIITTLSPIRSFGIFFAVEIKSIGTFYIKGIMSIEEGNFRIMVLFFSIDVNPIDLMCPLKRII